MYQGQGGTSIAVRKGYEKKQEQEKAAKLQKDDAGAKDQQRH